MTTKNHLPILHASERLQRAIQFPPLIAFHRPRNLKDLLVQAALQCTLREPPGNYRCRAPKCKTCPILESSNEFSSLTTGQLFKLKTRASCKSSNVIYLITCRKCGLQYVGEMGQPLHLRVNGHRFDITHRRTDESPVSNHFNSRLHALADMSIMVIEHAHTHDPCF